ncbi:metal-sensing transcriptional repressor [Alkaliphilus peptidifermentans]|uniref:DNA-binding transcriptional regulator, FrmR family n=1 Tax=Alkaliphilus peptidifermentans DSM 18978 TaxID=1120976 RepID=A0A1G5AST9_9FIRM|nr:metal-sensing transcriptional repressor [Alkaliphilus peptidifermentans]SCX80962.1 DNA-binding transcriptional regulator, FrmR family [Alkaliphilus peptidifermentans DSM 18978]
MIKSTKKPTEQSSKIQKSIIDRLNRVEGQIRGIKNMIEKGTYCDDVINQLEASRSALSSIELILLEGHIKNCIIQQLKDGKEESVDEVLKTIKKLIK